MTEILKHEKHTKSYQFRPHRFAVQGVLVALLYWSWQFPRKHRTHIALLGGRLFFFTRPRLGFAVPAMGINFLETYIWMIFGCVLASLPWGLAFLRTFVFGMVFAINLVTPRGPWGRAFGRYSLGLFFAMQGLYIRTEPT